MGDYDRQLTDREKAIGHLRTWSRSRLIEFCMMIASEAWIAKWAKEFDR